MIDGVPITDANNRAIIIPSLEAVQDAAFLLAFLALGAGYISHIPIPALAGVTAYVSICLLEWSTWRRFAWMRKVDALALLSTAAAVLLVNAVLAVANGCSFYFLHRVYARISRPAALDAALQENS